MGSCIDRTRTVAKDRGLDIPIDERDPLRGRASAKWILANARDAWVQWRCDQVTAFYARMAAKLRAFAAAYRALPAVVMKEIGRQGDAALIENL